MCEAAEKIYVQGIELGEERGEARANMKTARKLHQKGNNIAEIADVLGVSEKQVEEWLSLQMA